MRFLRCLPVVKVNIAWCSWRHRLVVRTLLAGGSLGLDSEADTDLMGLLAICDI